MFKSIFSGKQNSSSHGNSLEEIRREAKKIQEHFDLMRGIAQEAQQAFKEGNINKAKYLCEDAIFIKISDFVAHYDLLYRIYTKENKLQCLSQLKVATQREIPKKRNQLNGNDRKFITLIEKIDKKLQTTLK
jgi:soluble cytochrome b562